MWWIRTHFTMQLSNAYYNNVAKMNNINVVNDCFENSVPSVILPKFNYRFRPRSPSNSPESTISLDFRSLPQFLCHQSHLTKMGHRELEKAIVDLEEQHNPFHTHTPLHHGYPYCYHGNSKILLPWGVQLHHIFYCVPVFCAPSLQQQKVTSDCGVFVFLHCNSRRAQVTVACLCSFTATAEGHK